MKIKSLSVSIVALFIISLILGSAGMAQERVNINQVTMEELEQLYRVGPALAERIYKERETNGSFESLDDLGKRVKGIGPGMLSRWAEVSSLSYDGPGGDSSERAAELRALNLRLARGEEKLDPNIALADELELLYRVGPTLAERMVEEREKNGKFVSLNDISNRVGGIGEKMIDKWSVYVTLPQITEEENPVDRFDINDADQEDLESLFKVGPKLAERIIKEREENGSFTSLEELCQRVKGIGPTIVGSWREKVTNPLREYRPDSELYSR